MNYIIDPMWFYWMNVLGGVKLCLAIVGGITAAVFGLLAIFGYTEGADEMCKHSIVFALIGLALAIVSVFVPAKQTIIEMMIAKYATYDNAEWTVDAIKQAVDYIVQTIEKIR